MNTKQIAKEYRLSHWAGILRERKESGLNIKAFCERVGFHPNIYFYWQRKLCEAVREKLQPGVNARSDEALVSQGWVVCEKTESRPKESGISIEIGKCRVKVGGEVSSEQLEAVCRVLMSLC